MMRNDDQFAAAAALLGKFVRFAHQADSGPDYYCVVMKGDGSMVEILGLPGWFAPHLFVLASEHADADAE
jgi:hypothetical protein